MNVTHEDTQFPLYRRHMRATAALLAVGVLSSGCARFMEPEPLSQTASIVTGTEVARDPSFLGTRSGFGGKSDVYGSPESGSDVLAPALGDPFSLDDLTSNDANLPELRGIDFGAESALVDQIALPAGEATTQDFARDIGDTINFDTNSSELSEAARETLRRQAAWLSVNAAATAQIEGHADERGTRDYNLALGDRRASAVRGYLIAIGIDAGRINKISFGKERPIALGSDESAWSQNRRAVTVIDGGSDPIYVSESFETLQPLETSPNVTDDATALGTITYDPAPVDISGTTTNQPLTFDPAPLSPALFDPLPVTNALPAPSTATRIEDVSVDDLLRDPSLIDRLGAPQPGS